MKHFNVTGLCTPEQDYMADISDKLVKIKTMVDAGEYFTINRARQYGKTTTLQALKNILKERYIVVKISFEGLGEQFFPMNPDSAWDSTKFLIAAFPFRPQRKKILRIGITMPKQPTTSCDYRKKLQTSVNTGIRF